MGHTLTPGCTCDTCKDKWQELDREIRAERNAEFYE